MVVTEGSPEKRHKPINNVDFEPDNFLMEKMFQEDGLVLAVLVLVCPVFLVVTVAVSNKCNIKT